MTFDLGYLQYQQQDSPGLSLAWIIVVIVAAVCLIIVIIVIDVIVRVARRYRRLLTRNTHDEGRLSISRDY